MELGEFARHIYRYCLIYSGSVTSWMRSPEHNARVGGIPTSRHLDGLAVDVIYEGARPGAEADRELASRGLLRIVEGDHDHIMAPRRPTDG